MDSEEATRSLAWTSGFFFLCVTFVLEAQHSLKRSIVGCSWLSCFQLVCFHVYLFSTIVYYYSILYVYYMLTSHIYQISFNLIYFADLNECVQIVSGGNRSSLQDSVDEECLVQRNLQQISFQLQLL